MATTVAAPMLPVSVPTSLGSREVIDLGNPTLNLQKIENPQASLHECATRYGPQVLRSIFEKLSERDHAVAFEEIDLSDNLVGDEGAEWLRKGLRQTPHVKKLIMPRAGLGASGMKAIGALIGESPALENVILSSNICDAEGVAGDFGTGLGKNKSLRSLCLAACRLGDKGVEHLCAGPLRTHPTLEHLSLQYNRLEAAAAESLSKALAVNQALRYLDISGNCLGPEGAQALVTGLKANEGRLRRLSVAQNEITFQGAKAFVEHFMSPDGKNLLYLDLRHNAVPYPAMAQLRQLAGKPIDGPEGWMLLFGDRQLLLNR